MITHSYENFLISNNSMKKTQIKKLALFSHNLHSNSITSLNSRSSCVRNFWILSIGNEWMIKSLSC